jgi:hypothetical protein
MHLNLVAMAVAEEVYVNVLTVPTLQLHLSKRRNPPPPLSPMERITLHLPPPWTILWKRLDI